ncbi:DUF808 domain-containing protein [Motilimonas pumila]|uniref:DUF808 domain-containing protein n=1 Tax=Motilimonas pumila TaxID=2303987 RepID=A0A418YFD5_9GAMM|nr:DUF808 domain-containing protein [Motilimonas pumila]RJG48093.1 DUF808 domain-containing protein [Motilimonas pumila]
MAGVSLLALLDDIATVLDDVAVMSKMAARKTAGVLGDDLALNAQQVSGVRAEREIPVVWAVAKGSFRNKLILVPAALLISAVAPWLITTMLLLGGLFLCFEGCEKIFHTFFHHSDDQSTKPELELEDVVAFEQKKIAGAIRTDFILSAEIIVIALGTVQNQDLITQFLVVALIAIVMTVGVYGLVAGIVKLDDAGLYLVEHYENGSMRAKMGRLLVEAAPYLMKVLAVVGTIAMFLVGGGIVVHSIDALHHYLVAIMNYFPASTMVQALLPSLFNGLVGFCAGAIVLIVVTLASYIKKRI